MLLKVQELVTRQQPVHLQGTLNVDGLFADSREYAPIGPLEYEATAQAANDRILVAGRLQCRIRMQCSRCLEPIEERLELPFKEQFRVATDDDEEQSADDDDAIPITGERIDLAPLFAEELVVQLPYAPLCEEDCKGLCPECGNNLNERSCGCGANKIDPRMEALKIWFKNENN